MFLCEILTEQQQLPPPPDNVTHQTAYPEDGVDPELEGEDTELFADILPLKRYYLIQRLNELRDKLEYNNIQNNDLNIILKFMNNISYSSLLALSSGIIPAVENQLERLSTNG